MEHLRRSRSRLNALAVTYFGNLLHLNLHDQSTVVLASVLQCCWNVVLRDANGFNFGLNEMRGWTDSSKEVVHNEWNLCD